MPIHSLTSTIRSSTRHSGIPHSPTGKTRGTLPCGLLEGAETSENSAQSTAQTVDSGGEIAKSIVKAIGSQKGGHFRVDMFEKTTAARYAGRQHCFGTIMVCIGKGGLPEDVNVVSISKMAREQNQSESLILLNIRKGGTLLFTPVSFMKLVEGLIGDIREGKLGLPVLPAQLITRSVPENFKPLTIKRINV